MLYLSALDTLGCKLVLVAGGAVDLVLLGDEALGADGVGAHAAYEALLVPLPGLVLHLLHPGPEHFGRQFQHHHHYYYHHLNTSRHASHLAAN